MILVYIVIGVRIYREQLVQSLEARNEVRVVGCAATAADAADQIVDLGPDVVVVDTSAPENVADAGRLSEVAIAVLLVGLAAQEDDRRRSPASRPASRPSSLVTERSTISLRRRKPSSW